MINNLILNSSVIAGEVKEPSLVYKVGILLLSLTYAFALAYLLPMDGTILDRLNYLEYAEFSEVIFLRYLSRGFIDVIMNEPLWLFINISLNRIFDPEETVRIIILFSAFVTAFLVLNADPKHYIFLIFLLLFPMVIGKYTIHLRQGLAISIFLMGWFSLFNSWRLFWFSITPLIHASFFFVLFLFFLTKILQKFKFAIDLRSFIVVFIGLILGLGLGIIATMVGARQSEEYAFTSENVSGLGFVFWLIIFIIYWLQERKFTKEHAFVMTCIIFYLSTYFLIEVTARIFESTVIIVLLASLDLTKWRRKVFLLMFCAFLALSWLIKFTQPWLGWG